MNPANCCINCSYVKTPQVRPCRLHTAIHGGAGFTPLHLIQQAQFCKFCTIAIFLLQRAQQLADKQTLIMLKARCAVFVVSVAMDGVAPESSPGWAR